MKRVVFSALLLVISLSVASAAPLAKPSSGQIKKLIKEMLIENKVVTFVGIDDYKDKKCENIKVKKIKILKVGRASSTFYKESGRYLYSDFMVKFSILGSCNLTPAFRLNDSEYKIYTRALRRYNRVYEDGKHHGKKPTPIMAMDLSGRVPFRNIPFEVSFSTDNYGDWKASKYPKPFNKSDGYYSDKTKKYLRDLFYKKHGSTVKTWEKKQAEADSKMSSEAEHGLNVIQFSRLYTSEVEALLLSQPKPTKDYILRTYFSLNNRAKAEQFLRKAITLMRSKEATSKAPRKLNNSAAGNSHSHGGRMHSHKLPRQGKSHRHRNGPIGR